MNLDLINNPAEFNHFLLRGINLEEYRYKFLNDCIQRSLSNQGSIYETSVLNLSNTGWVLILHSDMLLVYGEGWNTDQIQELGETFNLNDFTNFTLAGDDELINQMIYFFKPRNYAVTKRRVFYQTNQVNIFENKNANVRLAVMSDLGELAVMLQEYYHEEYHGQNDKLIQEMEERVLYYIQDESIFVLQNEDDEIMSFCTVINPDIGILFTKGQYRNNGFGKILLSNCSNQLHKNNGTVYLMTDRDRLDSNLVCERVGFSPFFYYQMTEINRT